MYPTSWWMKEKHEISQTINSYWFDCWTYPVTYVWVNQLLQVTFVIKISFREVHISVVQSLHQFMHSLQTLNRIHI